MKCLFCNLPDTVTIVDENALAVAFYDAFPVTEYHTLVIPRRHVADYFELSAEEAEAVRALLQRQRERLLQRDETISGFNIGVNVGADAGQSIFHVHVHLIPRRKGDMPDPRGGVRGVIPQKSTAERRDRMRRTQRRKQQKHGPAAAIPPRRAAYGAVFMLLALMLLPTALRAQSLSASFDNDILFGSDGQYTGGVQIGWMSDELARAEQGSFAYGYIEGYSTILATLLPVTFEGMHRNGAVSIQGIAITPEDTTRKEPDYHDVPYMGATSAIFSLFVWDRRRFHEIQLAAGVIGPASGAGFSQKTFHKLIGNHAPEGWDNQLGNRLLLQAGYLYGICQYEKRLDGDYAFEWFNNLSASAGSGYVGAGAGSIVRLGRNMSGNFVTVSGFFSHSLARQLNAGAPRGGWGWDVNAGIVANALGYFYLYDAANKAGYDFEQPAAFLTGRLGADLYYRNVQLSLELYPSRPVDRYTHSNNFGRLNIVWWIP